ncbi:MAG: hypothetical protein U9N49_01520 [Campylobacterota bacterium]|nr:hypothetical protein [Campylobacterota bacterium]
MSEKPNQFGIRLVLVFIGIIVVVVLGRVWMLPDSWGEHGYYRGAYIDEEAHKKMKYGTNGSCKECHSEVNELKEHSVHKRLSCEICHAPQSEHIKDGKKIADMHIMKSQDQIKLCLTCHQESVGRPEKFPTIDPKQHLKEHNVKATHTCDQCHTVHAPMENINHARKLRTLKEAVDEK